MIFAQLRTEPVVRILGSTQLITNKKKRGKILSSSLKFIQFQVDIERFYAKQTQTYTYTNTLTNIINYKHIVN